MKKDRILKEKLCFIDQIKKLLPFLFKVSVIIVFLLLALLIVILVMISSFLSELTYTEIPNKTNTTMERKVYKVRWTGKKPSQTAKIILYDSKFGKGAIDKAKYYGDSFIDVFKMESQNYQLVTGPVAILLADILSANKTEKSIAEASEMYKMPKTINKLVGAAVLAKFDLLGEDEFQSGGLIYDLLANKKNTENFKSKTSNSYYIELALLAVVNAQAINMVPHIIILLKEPPSFFEVPTKAYDALSQLNAIESIPVLIELMKSEEFYALAEAFNVLISLGEEKAIPLAIARIISEKEGNPSISLIKALERHTGKTFGYDREAWEGWWHEKSNRVK